MAKKTTTHSKYKGVVVSRTDYRKIQERLQVKKKQLISHLVTQLSYIGEACVKLAREGGTYRDITGNLRSSIGYVVLYNGEVQISGAPKQYSGTQGNGAQGVAASESLLNRLKAKFPWGVVLIVCAGMQYAALVEDVRHKVVLAQAELEADRLLKELLGSILK